MTQLAAKPADQAPAPRHPRLGFLGLGWIGASRMRDLCAAQVADVVGLCDFAAPAIDCARSLAPDADRAESLDALLDMDIDGVVIATPSALHADQAIRALERGKAVFCQKPLARTAEETLRVITTAQRHNRLLGVDFSYRFTDAFRCVQRAIQADGLGEIYAAELTFHNAYGPDKSWFRDSRLSGGGCVIDLGIHLVDLAMVALEWPRIEHVTSHLYARGRRLHDARGAVEDYAVATLTTDRDLCIRLACSWDLHAGRDAVISMDVHGENGSAGFCNVNGSFYDFCAVERHGTATQTLCEPPDDWGGRALVAWARRLAQDNTFDPDCLRVASVSEVIDRIYGR